MGIRGPIYDKRLIEYPPHSSAVGRNVLRVWKARQSLWEASVRNEVQLKKKYKWAMWLRDDAYWFKDIVSFKSLRGSRVEHTVWSKDCQQWNGLNDKVVLMGRVAASFIFKAYEYFWRPSPELPSENEESTIEMSKI